MNMFNSKKKKDYKRYFYENKLGVLIIANLQLPITLILCNIQINNEKLKKTNFLRKLKAKFFYLLDFTLIQKIKCLLNQYNERQLKFLT